MARRIDALVFDLDDTLYPQAEFLQGAWVRVADRCAELTGVDGAPFERELARVAAEGSDRGGIIDRALDSFGLDARLAPELVATFHGFHPDRLTPYDGVGAALEALSARVPLVVLTDGEPNQQRAKLDATGLRSCFRAVVCSDDRGRTHRKPHPAAFRAALDAVGVPASQAVMIGDRPDKDVVGASAAGMRAIRVRQGEHRARPDHPATWMSVPTTRHAVEQVRTLVA